MIHFQETVSVGLGFWWVFLVGWLFFCFGLFFFR